LAGALLLVPASARSQAPPFTRTLAEATFDSAWARVDRTFYDTVFLATRWRTLRDSLRPVAQEARSNAELRAVLQALLSQVGVSHFGLIESEHSPALDDPFSGPKLTGDVPGGIDASLRIAEGRLVAWKVDSGGAAFNSGIRPGDVVTTIDGVAVQGALDRTALLEEEDLRREAQRTLVMRANAQLAGRPGDSLRISVSSNGMERHLQVVREQVRGRMSRFGNLPPMNAVVYVSERTVTRGEGKIRVGVISFSVWLPAVVAEIDTAFDRMRDADAIVIDLRGNPGGVAAMTGGTAGHLLDSAYALGTLFTRGATLQMRANPRRISTTGELVDPYDGPVAILIDPLSGSATEFFAAGLQGLRRARIFGETSAGASVPALTGRLPNGDVMIHAIAEHLDPLGRRVEGHGVVPDEIVPLSIAALAAGHDEALEAALKWAATQYRNQRLGIHQ